MYSMYVMMYGMYVCMYVCMCILVCFSAFFDLSLVYVRVFLYCCALL